MSSAPLEKGANMAAVGWLEMGSKRDAAELAKGYAARHMSSASACWFAVAPLLGGWIWEVQEGGAGKSHIPEIIKALSAGVERSWFRIGRRAYTISMRDGRPFCVLLPVEESREVLASGENRLAATGKMERVVKTGMGVFAFGVSVFLGGALFLGAAAGYYALSQRYVPIDRQVAETTLPHNQWSKVENVPPNLYVETLRLPEGGSEWQAVIKPIQQAPAQAPSDGDAAVEPEIIDDPAFESAPLPEILPADEFEPVPPIGPEPVPLPEDVPPPAETAVPIEVEQSDVPASPVPPPTME